MPVVDVLEKDAAVAFRVARELLLEMALLAPHDLDPIDNLILLGISQANIRQIVASPEEQLRYAFASTGPPDELRRPISAAAVSRALSLPIETVRRRAARLCSLGCAVAVPGGLVVPAQRIDGPQHKSAVAQSDRVLRSAFAALAEAGFFRPGDLSIPRHRLAEPPVRAAARLAGDFYLRMLAPLRACCGDPFDAVIVLILLRAGEAQPPSGADSDELPSVRPGDVAQALDCSRETVRRRLGRLVEAGLCQQGATGFAIPRRVVEERLLPTMAEPAQMNLRRLFRQLGEFWELGATAADLDQHLPLASR